MLDVVDVKPTDADVVLARTALLEITAADTVGEPAGSIVEPDGSLTLYFDTTLPGYVGWKWAVSISHAGGSGSSVLEAELMPSDGALLAPEWVPWSERLAEYKLAQADLAAQALNGIDSDEDGDDEDGDEDEFDEDAADFDEDDFDEDGLIDEEFDDEDFDDDDFDDEDVNNDDEALLHSGDLDGVNID